MAFQISPGVNVSEVDLTTVVPSILTTAGAFAGGFVWGPVNKRITVDSEITLAKTFGQPNSNTSSSFFTAASFLAYGNNLQVVRAANTSSLNASANEGSGGYIQITNEDVFEAEYLTGGAGLTSGPVFARYPGSLGNTLVVSLIDFAGNFPTWNVNGVGVSSYFTGAPGTSAQATAVGAVHDELHIVVVDQYGLFSGVKNSVLEVFPYVSKATDAIDSLGNSNYYKNVIFNKSKYVYMVDFHSGWDVPMANTTFTTSGVIDWKLDGGTDNAVSTAALQTAYSLFANSDETNVSLVLTGDASVTIQQYVIDNIVNSRKDCVAFVSPPSSAVVNNIGNETSSILSWNTSLARSTSYAVADSGWKYMFDKYNNVYRWVPLNGDIAGLCVYTDSVRDPWFSPAGFNRGNLKNVVKLAWNPKKTDRDSLYSVGINPVGTFPGNGTVLYGDKTLQSKPSAFDRINVRRLFIILEKKLLKLPNILCLNSMMNLHVLSLQHS